MTAFERAVGHVLDLEGGYVNDPADPGGETNFGISKRAYPDVDIAALTRDDAARIYYRDYWRPLRCGDLPADIALAVFDAAVNQGPSAAARMLQASAGAAVDGAIGPATLSAVRRAWSADRRELLADYLSRRAARYATSPAFERFGRGWMRRLFLVCLETQSED